MPALERVSRLNWVPEMSKLRAVICTQTFLTPKRWAPKFDWSKFNSDITFTDAESTGITPKEQEFIAKWRKPVRLPHLLSANHHASLGPAPQRLCCCAQTEMICMVMLLQCCHMLMAEKYKSLVWASS